MDSTEKAVCELCGQPMPKGEEMFRYHGYSGPRPPKPKAEEEARIVHGTTAAPS